MTRVGLISHSPQIAGAERMLYHMAVLLKNTDEFLPIVFIPEGFSTELMQFCKKADITFVSFANHVEYIFLKEPIKKDFAIDTLQMKEQLKLLLLECGIDIVLCNTLTSIGPVLAAFELQIPVITWVHGILDSYLLSGDYDCDIRLFFDRTILAFSNQVLCCSKWTANFYKKYSLDNIDILYNWTEEPSEIVPISLEKNQFVCLSSLQKPKGIFVLLEAANILAKTNHSFQVCFYGAVTEEMKKEMDSFIERNHLSQIVKIMDKTQKVQEVYNQCLCLVQPSFIESFGMTIVEAMSYQRPVIATKSGGPEEIVEDGITGFLVKRADACALAEKMKFLLEHKDIAIKMGKAGQEKYKKEFSQEQGRIQIINYLNKVVDTQFQASTQQYLIYDAIIHLLNTWAMAYVPSNKLVENLRKLVHRFKKIGNKRD